MRTQAWVVCASLLFAGPIAEATTLAIADISIAGSAQVTGIPQHQDCVSGPFPYESSFANGAGIAATNLQTHSSDGCAATTEGVYRTDFSVEVNSESGVISLDDDGFAAASASGSPGVVFCNPGACVGFEITEPTVFDLVFDFSYEMSASISPTPERPNGYRILDFFSSAIVGAQTSLCTYDSRPFECDNQFFDLRVSCDSTESPAGCDDSRAGNDTQSFQISIDEPGTYLFSFGVLAGVETRLTAVHFIPEPSPFILFGLTLVGLAGIRFLRQTDNWPA
jgi:hypothetical protein